MLRHHAVSYGAVALVVALATVAHLGALPTGWLTWPYSDKLMHLLLVGSLAFWFVMRWGDRRWTVAGLRVPLAVVAPFVLAAIEEGLQAFSPVRTAELGDLISDLVGLILFWWLGCRYLQVPVDASI